MWYLPFSALDTPCISIFSPHFIYSIPFGALTLLVGERNEKGILPVRSWVLFC